MKTLLRNLWGNLKAGSRLARFRGVSRDAFRVSVDQLVLLVLLDILISITLDYFENLPSPEFYTGAFQAYGLNTILFLLAMYLVARLLLPQTLTLALCVLVYSSLPFCYLVWAVMSRLVSHVPDAAGYWKGGVDMFLLAWLLVIIMRAVTLLAQAFSLRVLAAPLLFMVVWIVPVAYLAPNMQFWYAADNSKEDAYAAYRQLDGESILFNQYQLLDSSLGRLAAQRAGVDDVYFLGFAGYAHEDVFMKEIRFAQQLFDTRFDTRGRSLVLMNHLSTYESAPLATATNLRHALARIGKLMDTENDVLVMFLTSHGSRQNLSVRFWPLRLNGLTPGKLRQYLDEAQIKWRVIMVSACYSGGFVDALREPHTLIMTAAAPDRTSFGCGNDSDMTYFGEALLKDQLQQNYSFEEAFRQAAAEIQSREAAEQLEHSQPRIFVGEQVRGKLDALAVALPARI